MAYPRTTVNSFFHQNPLLFHCSLYREEKQGLKTSSAVFSPLIAFDLRSPVRVRLIRVFAPGPAA